MSVGLRGQWRREGRRAPATAFAGLLLALMGLSAGCATEEDVAKEVLQGEKSFVSSISPEHGVPGARIRIVGGDFGDSPGSLGRVNLLPGSGYQAVSFVFESWTDSLIFVRVPQVPPTATMGSKLQVVDSRGQVAYSEMPFVVDDPAAPQPAARSPQPPVAGASRTKGDK